MPIAHDVVICTADPSRLPLLEAALRGIRTQLVQADHVIIVVNSNQTHLRLVRDLAHRYFTRDRVHVIGIDRSVGTTDSRNRALQGSVSDVIIFLDDDARPLTACWSKRLLAPIESNRAVAARGKISADWLHRRPIWFPEGLLWTVGADASTHSASERRIPTVTGANMAWDRRTLQSLGGFDREFSRPPGTRTFGCDEVEACLRVSQLGLGAIVEVPGAEIAHVVTPSRATVRYVLRRCAFEGRSRARLFIRFGSCALNTRISRPRRIKGRPPLESIVFAMGWACLAWGFSTELVRCRLASITS
ncbi:MAG: glycosyltransferase family 2 protein [bacterium]|nr:glycosyltransferase family 2 protein [bacterium]